jgi:hypothetical protein
MSSLHLELADGRTRYRPGETLEGVAFWELDAAPTAVELRLFWRTAGKGTEDLEVVSTTRFDGVGARDRRAFRIALPPGPYSFSGTLVSLLWGLELVALPKDEGQQTEIIVTPGDGEIRLQALPK